MIRVVWIWGPQSTPVHPIYLSHISHMYIVCRKITNMRYDHLFAQSILWKLLWMVLWAAAGAVALWSQYWEYLGSHHFCRTLLPSHQPQWLHSVDSTLCFWHHNSCHLSHPHHLHHCTIFIIIVSATYRMLTSSEYVILILNFCLCLNVWSI